MPDQNNNQDEVQVPSYLRFSKVIVWLIYFWVAFGIALLVMRVFLLAFSANLNAGFANFVMEHSNDYLNPFRSLFEGRDVGETGYLDVSAMFAIIVYLFLVWGIRALIDYVQGKIDASEAEQKAVIEERKEAEREAARLKAKTEAQRSKSAASSATKKVS